MKSEYIIPYHEILPAFCKVRNLGASFLSNGDEESTTPRIAFIKNLLEELRIPYILDSWHFEPYGLFSKLMEKPVMLHNIYLKGTSNKMIMAHHDVLNFKIDNCIDNSASVINAIATKILNPEVNVVLTDGEEIGGHGSQKVGERILGGYFGEIEYVVNLELTACGGRNFFTEPYPRSTLYKKIKTLFPQTPVTRVPFHDGMILRELGIDSLVINPLPLDRQGKMDLSIIGYCHTSKDTIKLANYDEMHIFVNEIVTSLIQ